MQHRGEAQQIGKLRLVFFLQARCQMVPEGWASDLDEKFPDPRLQVALTKSLLPKHVDTFADRRL